MHHVNILRLAVNERNHRLICKLVACSLEDMRYQEYRSGGQICHLPFLAEKSAKFKTLTYNLLSGAARRLTKIGFEVPVQNLAVVIGVHAAQGEGQRVFHVGDGLQDAVRALFHTPLILVYIG